MWMAAWAGTTVDPLQRLRERGPEPGSYTNANGNQIGFATKYEYGSILALDTEKNNDEATVWMRAIARYIFDFDWKNNARSR